MVMGVVALFCPPLRNTCEIIIPSHFPHVGSIRLAVFINMLSQGKLKQKTCLFRECKKIVITF